MRASVLLLVCMVAFTVQCLGEVKEDEVLVQALQDEMSRSLAELQLEAEPKPYFISYMVTEVSNLSSTYVLGSQTQRVSGRSRLLSVVVRVGSKKLDNTNWYQIDPQFLVRLASGDTTEVSLPLADKYDQLVRAIRDATERAYENAVTSLSAKKSALVRQSITDRPNDFSDEETFTFESDPISFVPSLNEISLIARELSQVFKGMHEIYHSASTAKSSLLKRLYMDSEGNFNRVESSVCRATAHAKTRTTDGFEIVDARSFYASNCDGLGDIADLQMEASQMANGLIERRSAERLDHYTGPILFEGKAAAMLIAQTLGLQLSSKPEPVFSDPQYASMIFTRSPFLRLLSSSVMPSFLSIVNDPTLTKFAGNHMLGAYVVDDEGMPTRRTELISNGKLVGMLSTRSPTSEFSGSTGSNRGQGGPSAGSLLVEASEGHTMEEMRAKLLELVKSKNLGFGLVVKKIISVSDLQETDGVNQLPLAQIPEGSPYPAIDVAMLYPDGREVSVLPVSLSFFHSSDYQDINAASSERWHINHQLIPRMQMLRRSFMGLRFHAVVPRFVSVVSPALLFDGFAVQPAGLAQPLEPLVRHPMSED